MAGPVYAADPSDSVRSAALDGLTLLFHRPSGLTHFLATPAPEILAALGERPADADALLAHFGLGAEGRDAMAARLGELEASGLVRRL